MGHYDLVQVALQQLRYHVSVRTLSQGTNNATLPNIIMHNTHTDRQTLYFTHSLFIYFTQETMNITGITIDIEYRVSFRDDGLLAFKQVTYDLLTVI